jgi:hypothetical protein
VYPIYYMVNLSNQMLVSMAAADSMVEVVSMGAAVGSIPVATVASMEDTAGSAVDSGAGMDTQV